MNFTSVLGTIPRGARTLQEVAAAGFSVKKDLRTKFSTSDQLKLSKLAIEGGRDKFSFFETSGSIGNDFKAVYGLHMHIKTLSKTLVLFDIVDVFQIIPENIVIVLEVHLKDLFNFQRVIDARESALLADPAYTTLAAETTTASNDRHHGSHQIV